MSTIIDYKQKNFAEEASDYLTIMQNNLQKMINESLNDHYEQFIRRLVTIKGKVIMSGMGKCNFIARKISSTLSSTGKPSLFIHPAEASHGDMGMITRDDCLFILSKSGETEELFNILNYAQKNNITIFCITENPKSTLAKASQQRIIIPKVAELCPLNLAPTSSTSLMLCLGDAIAMSLLSHSPFTKEDFNQIHPGGSLGKKFLKVGQVMHESLPLVLENTTLDQAILTMTNKCFGCVGVMNSKKQLIGVFTDGDLRRSIYKNLKDTLIKNIMTKKPLTIKKDSYVIQALEIMNDKKITNIFVVEESIPIGIIHIHDLIRLKI